MPDFSLEIDLSFAYEALGYDEEEEREVIADLERASDDAPCLYEEAMQ